MIDPNDQYIADLDAEYQQRQEAAERAHAWADRAITDPCDVCEILADYGSLFGYDLARVMRNLPALCRGDAIAQQAVCEALTGIEDRLHAIAVKMAPED